MVDIKLLEKEIKKQGVQAEQISNALNVDLSTWYRRKTKPQTFKIEEVEKLKELLCLSDEKAIEIFLGDDLRKRE